MFHSRLKVGAILPGQSNPFSPTVYETSRKVNLKDDYDISKIGWVKYSDG